MALRYDQLASRLEQSLAPVYLIAGEEPLLLQESCDLVRAAARAKGFIERELLQVEAGFDWTLLQQAAAPSLFASRKIIDLRLPSGKPGSVGAKALSAWAQAPVASIVLMVSCEKWDASSRKSKWAARLERAGQRVEIWPLKPKELRAWMVQRIRHLGMQVEPDAVALLADRLEGNLLAAKQEVDRLALLNPAGRIGVEDIVQAVADSSRFDAFTLAECMLAGDLHAGLRAVAGLRRMQTPLPLLLGALLRELKITEAFRLALRGGEQEVVAFRRLNIWRNKQQLVRAAARRLDTRRLFDAFKLLALIDRQSKGRATGDPWESLDALLIQLS